MTARTRRRLAQGGSFLLAGVLLWLALRGVDLQTVWEALRTADYRWLAPLALLMLASHLLRAWRWVLLLRATDAPPKSRPATLRGAFYSVMIGYMVNYAAPRLGEAARTANLSARTRRPFSGVFGTVVVERLLDTAVLGLALVSTGLLLIDQLGVLNERGALAGGALVVWGLRRRALWADYVRPTLRSFKSGLLSLGRTGRPWALTVSTAGIWVCYGLMAYLPLLILEMAGPYDLSLIDGWCLMALGAIGVAIPSPGGTGSYHYITIQSLVWLFAVPRAPAATYAVLTHGAQLVVYVIVGFACLLAQGRTLGDLWGGGEPDWDRVETAASKPKRRPAPASSRFVRAIKRRQREAPADPRSGTPTRPPSAAPRPAPRSSRRCAGCRLRGRSPAPSRAPPSGACCRSCARAPPAARRRASSPARSRPPPR
ncbi:MAG: TIGR00374 family protein [Bacteroidetes bacterium SW_4_67_19]|nr:MAG: TIGR00374 family protein [Bacteroidetes bacterium SW_4_67_19]